MSDQRFYISNIEHPTPDTVVLELSRPLNLNNPQNGEIFDFKPGQYIMLSYQDEYGRFTDRHAFSIASSPTQKNHLKLGIRIGGRFTRGLAKMNPGDEILVAGPYGKFVFNPRKHRDLVFVAGGIGITPFLSAIQYATDHRLSNKLSLLYSNKTLEGTLFQNEIRELESLNPNFRALFCVTEKMETSMPGVVNKRINPAVIDDFVGNVKGKTFFICGPAPFMAGMQKNLEILGVSKHQIEMEEFSMLQSFDLVSATKSAAYALGLSGALILLPLYLFINHAEASGDNTGYGSIFSSTSPYSVQNIYKITRQEYDKLFPKAPLATVKPTETVPPPSSTPIQDQPAVIPATKAEVSKTITKVKSTKPSPAPVKVTKTPAKKTAPVITTVKPVVTVPTPKTEVSPTILAEQQAQAAAAQAAATAGTNAAPSPLTAASAVHATTGQTTQTQTTQTSAPAPVTSASTVASGGTGAGTGPSGSTGSAPSATAPTPVTSASGVVSGGTTGSAAGGTTVTNPGTTSPVPTSRHHDDDDD